MSGPLAHQLPGGPLTSWAPWASQNAQTLIRAVPGSRDEPAFRRASVCVCITGVQRGCCTGSCLRSAVRASHSDKGMRPVKPVRIVVVGDAGVGKSSLITAAATESFPEHPPPVLPPTRLPHDTTPEGVPMVLVDTSSRPEDKANLELACRNADVVILCFDSGLLLEAAHDQRTMTSMCYPFQLLPTCRDASDAPAILELH